MVLAVALASVGTVTARLRCIDAAAVGARLAARGEPAEVAVAAARAAAPGDAVVRLEVRDGAVTVTVTSPTHVPGLAVPLRLPAVVARFSEPLEPGLPG